ncbi:MAG: Rpp14/Pop5 family protein [Candidatus Bathycorpusculaceae bacterium]
MKKLRRRYLALKIDSDETFSSKDFMDEVWSAVSKLYGEYGASQTGLALIDYDMEKGFAVLRVAHTAVNIARTAIASITKIENKPATIHVLTVSGTIKALYKKMGNRKLI